MSKIHQCNDGSQDITGRATPPTYVPCSDSGGVVGQTPRINVDDDNIGPSPNNKQEKRTPLLFILAGVGTIAILGHWVYKNYIKK